MGSKGFNELAACTDPSRFSLRTSLFASSCLVTVSSEYSRLCWRMACLRGSEILHEEENSISATEIGLAGKAKRSRKASLGGG